jgi:hypothetical protein
MDMAVGFKLSNVLEIEIDPEEDNALIFTTKAIRYRIIFDDVKKRDKMVQMIAAFREPKQGSVPEKPKKTFYIEESKMHENKP